MFVVSRIKPLRYRDKTNDIYDILIVGAGLTGLITALALAHKGARVALLDRVNPQKIANDRRASAIAASSFEMFRHLGLVDALSQAVQPIEDILISDGEVGRISPLTLHFDSQDITRGAGGAMGYMVENDALRLACFNAIKSSRTITLLAPVDITDTRRMAARAEIDLASGQTVSGALIVAADGRNSRLRQSAGIGVDGWPYGQKGLVTTIAHTRPHNGIAHEIFYPTGPLAVLPLTGDRSSIVWSDKSATIDAALQLSQAAFTVELQRRTVGRLGDITTLVPPNAYPLGLQMAERYSDTRLALVGDAAHAIHPIAGQGLNMGLRDAAALADVVAEARGRGLDIGGASLADYAAWRNFDNRALALSTDVFNRLFSNNIMPVKHARRLGLALIDAWPSARGFFMREAAGQLGELPSLLRPV